MTDVTTIPLNKLVPSADNVRKTGAGGGIDELAASIAAHGLLQSLVVRKTSRGKHAVVAGNRRLAALKALAKAGDISADYGVPCRVIDRDDDAMEIGLAENVVRMPMHPADQFEAFRELIDGGASVADVAARFGVAEAAIAKRLRLGRLSPVILDAYRSGEIGLEEAQAFAITDDRDAQERVWSDLPDWNREPRSIRRALTDGEVPVSDKRVRFVGLDAYEAAGGVVRRDLFDEAGATLLDEDLLDRLVLVALKREAEAVRAEGWAWIEVVPDLDRNDLTELSRRYPERVPLSDDDQAELDRLTGEYGELAEQAEADPDDADLAERLDAIDEAIDALHDRAQAFPDDVKAIAGAVVTLIWDGQVDVQRGLVRPEDEPAKPKQRKAADADGTAVVLPASLVESLTAVKTAILRHALSGDTDIALAAVVHALASQVVFLDSHGGTCLDIRADEEPLANLVSDTGCSEVLVLFEEQRQAWEERLPANPDDLWSWCVEQDRDVLLELLAFCAAASIDAVRCKQDRAGLSRFAHADTLVRALSVDFAAWYRPSADGFFRKITAASIHAALREARGKDGAPAWAKLKKAELAALAEREIASTGWLPEPLCITESEPADTTGDDAQPVAEAAE